MAENLRPIKKLAIVSTHPVQYNAPLFRLLAQRGNVQVKVFYTWGESVLEKKYDPGFGKVIEWDIPLLEGYGYTFLENSAADKGTHHFKGIDNPGGVQAIRDYDPDAILIYGWSYKGHLKLMRTFHGKVPILFRGDSTLLKYAKGGVKALVRRVFLTWVYAKVDVALYVGTNNLRYYKHAGMRDRQLVYAPHGVDNDRFSRKEDYVNDALSFRKKLDIPADALVFLFAGKLEDNKDPLLLLRAFMSAGLEEKAHLVVVGNGHLEQAMREAAEGRQNIHFLGFQNQSMMPVVYCIGDVFVLPSKSETWGLALNESMAGGSAVIASDRCGGAIDLITPGSNGFIFASGDAKDLAEKMSVIARDRAKLADMKAASMEKVKAFSYLSVAKAIEGIMASLNNS